MNEPRCIVTIVERGKADKIVREAKKAGADGATIFYGRGSGEKEALKLFNIHIESSKEVILIISEEEKYKPIFDTIIEAGKLKKPGAGIIFTFPLSDVIGLCHRKEINIDN